jgi:hypothetical protein
LCVEWEFQSNAKETAMNTDKPSAKGDPRTAAERERDQGPLGHHPVGTAAGGVAGAAAGGAMAGSVAGPAGAVIGGAIGAIAGGLAGKGIADIVDPTMEDEYWRQNWANRSYIDGGFTYDQDYGPAYRYGVDSYVRYTGRPFDEAEPELERDWDAYRGESRLSWERARPASRDAWVRVSDQIERAVPGDRDRDGK